MKKTIPLIISVLLLCGCINNQTFEETTTTTQQKTQVTLVKPVNLLAEPKNPAQKGLDNNTIKIRGFYRDDEFIIIGVLQNPYNYEVSVKLKYILYSSLNISTKEILPKETDIVPSYLPAKATAPFKINCGKAYDVDSYKLDWDYKKISTEKTKDLLRQINSSATIKENIITIKGEIINRGTEKTKNTRITAILYDKEDKAIDLIEGRIESANILPNETATYNIEKTYPRNYADYLQKIEHYRIWAQNDQPTTTTNKSPIEITGTDNITIEIQE